METGSSRIIPDSRADFPALSADAAARGFSLLMARLTANAGLDVKRADPSVDRTDRRIYRNQIPPFSFQGHLLVGNLCYIMMCRSRRNGFCVVLLYECQQK